MDITTRVLFILFVVFIAVVLVGMLYTWLNRERYDFLRSIDEGSSDSFYTYYVEKILKHEGYSLFDKKNVGDKVKTTITDGRKEYILIVCVKRDYIYDVDVQEVLDDIGLAKGSEDIMLCINSYYRGESDYCVRIDRRNLWKECGKNSNKELI